jgi:hypothetical protein
MLTLGGKVEGGNVAKLPGNRDEPQHTPPYGSRPKSDPLEGSSANRLVLVEQREARNGVDRPARRTGNMRSVIRIYGQGDIDPMGRFVERQRE